MSRIIKNENGESFKFFEQSEIADYVSDMRKQNSREVKAEKTGCVIAEQVTEPAGRDVVVWVENGTKEASEHIDQGKWIVTAANKDTKQPVIDANGHTNSWGVDDKTFKKKYDVANIDDDGFVKPKGGEQLFIQIKDDICIDKPWGENGAMIHQYLKAGSYLNITDPSDVYGIAEEEFGKTYGVNSVVNNEPVAGDSSFSVLDDLRKNSAVSGANKTVDPVGITHDDLDITN